MNHGKYGGACMPGLDMQNYATNPYYARSIASIMPVQTWRDTGHKALCPVHTGHTAVCPVCHTFQCFPALENGGIMHGD